MADMKRKSAELLAKKKETLTDISPSCLDKVSQRPVQPPDLKGRHTLQMTLTDHKEGVTAVKFSPDAIRVASASSEGTAIVHDVESGDVILRLTGHHTAGLNDIAWNKTHPLIATASDDKTACIWDVRNGKCIKVLKNESRSHTHVVFSCCFNAVGNILATASFDETMILWDVAHGTPIKQIPGHSDPITCVDFDYQDRDVPLLASSSTDGLCRIWAADGGRCLRTLTTEMNPPISHIKFTPNGQYVLKSCMASPDGQYEAQLQLVHLIDSSIKKVYRGHVAVHHHIGSAFLINKMTGSADCVVSGSEDSRAYIWDLNSQEIISILGCDGTSDSYDSTGHSDVVLGVDCCSAGMIATCSLDKTVRIWNAA